MNSSRLNARCNAFPTSKATYGNHLRRRQRYAGVVEAPEGYFSFVMPVHPEGSRGCRKQADDRQNYTPTPIQFASSDKPLGQSSFHACVVRRTCTDSSQRNCYLHQRTFLAKAYCPWVVCRDSGKSVINSVLLANACEQYARRKSDHNEEKRIMANGMLTWP